MDGPGRRTHLLPRTRDGWIAGGVFAALFVLALPPVTHVLLDRVEPWVLGFPFFFVVLLAVYTALIAVLGWAYRRGV